MAHLENVDNLVQGHFELFKKNLKLEILNFKLFFITQLTSNHDLRELSRKFCDDFVFFSRIKKPNQYSITSIERTKGTDQFEKNVILPTMMKSKFFASIQIKLGKISFKSHCMVMDKPKIDDITTIINPFTSSYYKLKNKSITENSPKKISYDFDDAFGKHAAHYEAVVDPHCRSNKLINCGGRASGWDRGIFNSAHVEYDMRRSGSCCVLNYGFVGTGGWPSVEFNFPSEAGTYGVKIGRWGWTYFNEIGSISKCCPKRRKKKLNIKKR